VTKEFNTHFHFAGTEEVIGLFYLIIDEHTQTILYPNCIACPRTNLSIAAFGK